MDKRTKQYYDIGRLEAKRLYSLDGVACLDCGRPAAHRHHADGDTHNNTPSNVALLCHRCHLRRERQEHKVGSRTRLTLAQIERIKGNESIRQLSQEIGMTEAYLRRIRNGEKNPKPVETDTPFVIPDDFQWRERRGKRRSLTVTQVREILSYQPTLGRVNAERLALKFNVGIASIWKARSRSGCYSDCIYD